MVAPKLVGRDPLEIDRISKDLTGYLGFRSTGPRCAAIRGGYRALGTFRQGDEPADRQLLGGFSRREIRTYNTCAGHTYMRDAKGQQTAN